MKEFLHGVFQSFCSDFLHIFFKGFVDRLRTKLLSLKLSLENFVDRFENS